MCSAITELLSFGIFELKLNMAEMYFESSSAVLI